MSDNNFTRIADDRIDQDSPVTEDLADDWTSNQNHGTALVRSDGTEICGGTSDTITNVSNSVVTDAAPTDGLITNILVGHVIEMVDGDAQGVFATVTVAGSGSTFTVDANLVAAGAAAGDTYRIIYGVSSDLAHNHDGVNSPKGLDIPQVYSETGDNQSDSATSQSSSAVDNNITHTLILPAGVHLVLVNFDLEAQSLTVNGGACDATITANTTNFGDPFHTAEVDGALSRSTLKGGTFSFLAENGDVLNLDTHCDAHAGFGDTKSSGKFNVLTSQITNG